MAGILQEGDHGGALRPPGALTNAVGIEGRRGSQSDRVCISPGTPSEMGWWGGATSSRGTETPASAAPGTVGEAQILDAVGLSRRGSIVPAERGAGWPCCCLCTAGTRLCLAVCWAGPLTPVSCPPCHHCLKEDNRAMAGVRGLCPLSQGCTPTTRTFGLDAFGGRGRVLCTVRGRTAPRSPPLDAMALPIPPSTDNQKCPVSWGCQPGGPEHSPGSCPFLLCPVECPIPPLSPPRPHHPVP